jgi:hypothetical protein
MQRRILSILVGIAFVGVLAVTGAWAGNPHIVSTSVTCGENSVTVCVKEAGLGDEAQIVTDITATAECINNGGNHPRAVNKEDLAETSTEPVQNGQASFCETLTATFKPECTPPMTVEFVNIVYTDTTNNLTRKLGDCP